MAMEKISLTLEEEVVAEAREAAGARGLSGFVNRAIRHLLQRERLASYLAELEKEHGPIDPQVREEVRREWQDPARPAARRRSV